MSLKKSIISIILVLSLVFSFSSFAFASEIEALPFEDSQFFIKGDYSIHYRYKSTDQNFKGRMILIHGFTSSTVFWEDAVEYFNADGYDCLLVDLPGFGYSTRETKDISPISREELLADLMQELAGEEKWIIGGHSMGGGVALNLVGTYPELIEAVLLYAPAVNFTYLPMSDSLANILGKMTNGLVNFLVKLASTSVGKKFVTSFFDFPEGYDLDSRIFEPLLIENTGMSIIYMLSRSNKLDPELTKNLDIPFLLCLAEKDAVVKQSSSMAIEIKNALPSHAVTVSVPDANHLFVETHSEIVAGLSLDFLANA